MTENPTETDWFPTTSVGFDGEVHKPKISISVGQHVENRPNQTDYTSNAMTKDNGRELSRKWPYIF